MAKDVIMPVLGMNQETGTLVEWFVVEGSKVTKGEPLMLVATDKAEVEIEATASGILANVNVHPGDEVAVGSALALILAEGEAAPTKAALPVTPLPVAPPSVDTVAAPTASQTQQDGTIGTTTVNQTSLPTSPVAARIAAEHGIDLATIQAKGGRIQKEDVLAHIAALAPSSMTDRILASPKARRLAQESNVELSAVNGTGPDGAILTEDILAAILALTEVEESDQQPSAIEPMSRAWKVMAQRLQESWQTVPHFYLERTVDVTNLMAWRKQIQKRAEQKITVTDLLTKVVAVALTHHPRLNASWIDEQIVMNQGSNIGLAVAIEDGLLVPVIHDADILGIETIAICRANIVEKALTGKLGLEEMQGGTFTISNLGMFGITKFNAIVNPPQAAILAVGSIEERVVPVKGKPKVRPMMTLTLSCDHRVVDGARGAQFMRTVVEYLEDPLRLLD